MRRLGGGCATRRVRDGVVEREEDGLQLECWLAGRFESCFGELLRFTEGNLEVDCADGMRARVSWELGGKEVLVADEAGEDV